MPQENSPNVQAQLDADIKAYNDLLQAQNILANKKRILLSMPQSASTARDIAALNDEMAVNAGKLAALKAEENRLAAGLDPGKIASAEQREVTVKSITSETTLPTAGKLLQVHPKIEPGDLITYMTQTQHLNPYGRNRQCDTDLADLMGLIQGDHYAEIGANLEMIKNLGSSIWSRLTG